MLTLQTIVTIKINYFTNFILIWINLIEPVNPLAQTHVKFETVPKHVAPFRHREEHALDSSDFGVSVGTQ